MKKPTGANPGTDPDANPGNDGHRGADSSHWFDYPIRVQPHHTDYAGIVWHGTYITWLESARVDALAAVGVKFADLVAMGVDLPVVDLSLKYHRSLRLGDEAVVRSRPLPRRGVRLIWDYRIESPLPEASQSGNQEDLSPLCYVTGQVTLVALDAQRGTVLRRYPPLFQSALDQFAQG